METLKPSEITINQMNLKVLLHYQDIPILVRPCKLFVEVTLFKSGDVQLLQKSTGRLLLTARSLFLTCYPWVFVHPGTGDVRPTDAGITCLYCVCFQSCYVLDAGMSGVFVWTGRKAPLELKKGVWNSVLVSPEVKTNHGCHQTIIIFLAF